MNEPLYIKLTPLQDLRGPSDSNDTTHCLMFIPNNTSLFLNDLTLISHERLGQGHLPGSQLARGHHPSIDTSALSCGRVAKGDVYLELRVPVCVSVC